MANVLDTQEKNTGNKSFGKYFNLLVYSYAILLSLMLALMATGIEIKTAPTPMEAEAPTEIQASYSMLAGICINVGQCGNDQVVLGLESNMISRKFYQFLVWKSKGREE